MSFLKNLIDKIKSKPQPDRTNPHTLIVLESDTLGMTVIQQKQENQLAQLSIDEWETILKCGKLDGVPYNKIYFSFLKGIPDLLQISPYFQKNENLAIFMYREQRKKLFFYCQGRTENVPINELFQKLISSEPMFKQSQQIQKDIKRTYSNKLQFKYTQSLMRKTLYALSNSGVEYSQGMNYILLYVIIFCLESLGLDESSFGNVTIENERDIFIILRQIVLRLDEVFDNQNIFKILGQLEQQISLNVPDIFFNIHKMGMDSYSLFSQNYYSLLTYSNPPDELTKSMIDLFFLEGHKAITCIIVRMLEIAREEILKIKDPQILQKFVKTGIFEFCFQTWEKQKIEAKSINDFGISFYQNTQEL